MVLHSREETRVLVRGNRPGTSAVIDVLRVVPQYDVVVDTASEHDVSDRMDIIILVAGGSTEARDLLHRAGSMSKRPILVVCSDSSPSTAVDCLRGGADDYVISPFDRCELLARIDRSLQRDSGIRSFRIADASENAEAPFESVVLREHDWTISIHDHLARLTQAQFRLVAHLITRPGQWVRTQFLQDRALQSHATIGASNVRYHILNARTALGRYAQHLHGWQRRGYMWSFKRCDTPHCAAPCA